MPKDLTDKYQDFELKKADGTPVPDEEPVFVLRAQDILAPVAMAQYADLYEWATGDSHHAGTIRAFAKAMTVWPTRKLPD